MPLLTLIPLFNEVARTELGIVEVSLLATVLSLPMTWSWSWSEFVVSEGVGETERSGCGRDSGPGSSCAGSIH